MYEEAATTDQEGNIVDLDFDTVRNEYGDSADLQEIEAIIEESYEAQSGEIVTTQSFTQCMIDAFADQFGVTVSTGLFTSVGAYLKAGSWKAAAKAIISVIGAKPAVAAVAGWLAWNTGVCL